MNRETTEEDLDELRHVLRTAMDRIDNADQKTWESATVPEAWPLLRLAYRDLLGLRCKLDDPERKLQYGRETWEEDGVPWA